MTKPTKDEAISDPREAEAVHLVMDQWRDLVRRRANRLMFVARHLAGEGCEPAADEFYEHEFWDAARAWRSAMNGFSEMYERSQKHTKVHR